MIMDLKRSFDATFINEIIAHPSVKRGAEIVGELDLTAAASDPNNVLLQNDHTAFLLLKKAPCIYEVHTQCLPQGRGPQLREAIKKAFDYMFIATDCMKVITRANEYNRASVKLSKDSFEEKGKTGHYFYFQRTIQQWLELDYGCINEGERFHKFLEGQKNHVDDQTHDAYVGAAILMAQKGNMDKAQLVYNSWCLMSGYEPIHILSRQPLICRIGDMIIDFEHFSKMEVIPCP